MKRVAFILVFLIGAAGVLSEVLVSGTKFEPMLSMEPQATETEASKVTAVYGITADDYLPTLESVQRNLRPQVRGAASHPSFDLPDAFYFIGGPIFLLLFLRVLVIFLNEFEERRKEELRAVAKETLDPE